MIRAHTPWQTRSLLHAISTAAAILGLVASTSAFAYPGDSFMSIKDGKGSWRGDKFKGWIRVENHIWQGRMQRGVSGLTDPLAGDKLYFGGPNVVPPGNPGRISIVLSKTNPDTAQLMERCTKGAAIPELTYAESSDRARPGMERGPRPAEFPDYWEYKLKNVRILDCPVLAGAVDQAFVLSFDNIEWLNYDFSRSIATQVVVKPQDIPNVQPIEATENQRTRSYLVTWVAPVSDSTSKECPALNGKPTLDDAVRFLTPEEAADLKATVTSKGGNVATADMGRRGPHRLDVTTMPGIVPDPGLKEPQTTVAMGMNLDGDDGLGAPPKGVRKHVNFTSPDGRTGIDNQLYRVLACVPGYRGKQGYANQTPNARRADGNIVTLIEISGIDNDQNDDHVEVSIIHSLDKPIRNNAGKTFVPNYTFRPTDDPNFSLYNTRVRGRIVNGAVETDEIPHFQFNPGQGGITDMYKVRMRFAPQPDGSALGTIGGYVEWKKMMAGFAGGYGENLFNFQAPAIYYAMRRNADGLQDPVTGEFNGISMAYEVDTVPAFVTGGATTRHVEQNPAYLPVRPDSVDVVPNQKYSTTRTTLQVLYDNPQLKAIIARDAPDLIKRSDMTGMAMAMTLREMRDVWRVYPSPPDLSNAVLAQIDKDLSTISAQN